MKYLSEIIYTALICGIILKIGHRESSKNSKLVKFVVSLAFLTVLTAPLISLADSGSGIPDSIFDIVDSTESTTFDKSTSESVITKAICDTVAGKASERFSVPKEDFSIKITISEIDSDEYTIEKVQIYRKGEAKNLNCTKVRNFFEEIFDNAGEVIIDDEKIQRNPSE